MTTVSERDRCLEIERGISRLLLSPNDDGTICMERPPTGDVGRLPTRIAPMDEMFRPLRRPFKVRKRERKKNAVSEFADKPSAPMDVLLKEVPEDVRRFCLDIEGKQDTQGSTYLMTEEQEPKENAPAMDSAHGGGPARPIDGPDRRKQRGKEKKRNKAASSVDRSENGANRQRGRWKKMDGDKLEGGVTEPRKILQRPMRGVFDDGNIPQAEENDTTGPTPHAENPLRNIKVLYLNDLERDLLGATLLVNQDEATPQGAEERGQNESPALNDSEELDPEFSTIIARKLELFKMHHILPLKKKSGRFPRARFYCHLCRRHLDDHWYVGKHMDHDDHLTRKAVKDMRLAIKNLPYPVDVQSRAIAKLVEQVAEKHGLSGADVVWRKEIVNDLEAFLASSIPGVRLLLYGSSLSGFGLKDSNINVELVYSKEDDCADVLTAAAEALATNPECTSLTKKFEDRVPRISFKDKRSNLVCELCVNNSNSQKTTKLLSDYASLDPRVRTLGVAFRQWARICGLDSQERGTLPPHAFSIMTIYFLQQCRPPVLPVLHELKKGDDVEAYTSPEELCKEGHWTCQNDRGVGQLWVEMLRFYAVEFKLNRRAVCIRRFKPMLHSEKKWNKRYIGIEDPYSRKRNLARSIPCEQMFIFLKRCLRTSAVYFHLPQLPAGPLFTVLPGPPLYEDDSECEVDAEDRDGSDRDGAERKKGQSAADKATDEEDDEDDDDASSTSSEVPDLDEQDPDLSFDEVARVIANMDLAEDPNEPKKSVRKAVQFVRPGPPIPPDLLGELESLAVEDFTFEFSRKVLASGKNPPLICLFCQKRGHLQNNCPEQQLPKLKELPPMTRSFMNVLDDLCLRVLDSISPHPQEEQQRQELLCELETFIRELYKDAKLSLFGSSCNGFGLVRSDLDICLTFESSKDGKDLDHEHVIEELAKKLQMHPDLDRIIAITTAKVPIVKFFHKLSSLEGDISLYNTLAQHNTRLLKAYSDIDERVKVLGYTFKHFAKVCDIGDASRGSLSSYAYVLMTLYYLQQCKPPVIPVLQELYQEGEKKPEVMVDGWNAWFFDDIDSLQEVWSEFGQNNESVGELWLGMLRFYTEEFNFKEYIISIRQRKPLTRLQKMWTSKSIAIEDPFDLDHNLGTGVSRKMNTYIMKALIKGRALFGTPIKRLPSAYPDYLTFFFDRHQLTDGHPPNDRGCRACGKIGHRVKECPRRRGTREPAGSNYTERIMTYGQQMRPRIVERKLWAGDNKLLPQRRRPQRGEEHNGGHEAPSRKEDSELDRTGTAGQPNAEREGLNLQTPRNAGELGADASNGTGQSAHLEPSVPATELYEAQLELEPNSNVYDCSLDSSDACTSQVSWEPEIEGSSGGGSDGRNVLESTPKSESQSTTDASSREANSAKESRMASENFCLSDTDDVERFGDFEQNCGGWNEDGKSSSSARFFGTNFSEQYLEPKAIKNEVRAAQTLMMDDNVGARQTESPQESNAATCSRTVRLVPEDKTVVGAETRVVRPSEPPETERNKSQMSKDVPHSSGDRTAPHGKARWRLGRGSGVQTRPNLPAVGTLGKSERLLVFDEKEPKASRGMGGETSFPGSGEATPVRRRVLDKSMLLREMNAIISAKDCNAGVQSGVQTPSAPGPHVYPGPRSCAVAQAHLQRMLHDMQQQSKPPPLPSMYPHQQWSPFPHGPQPYRVQQPPFPNSPPFRPWTVDQMQAQQAQDVTWTLQQLRCPVAPGRPHFPDGFAPSPSPPLPDCSIPRHRTFPPPGIVPPNVPRFASRPPHALQGFYHGPPPKPPFGTVPRPADLNVDHS